MTVVNPKSISGINSITMASGGDNLLTIHANDTSEKVRVNSSGDVIIGSGVTLSPDGDIFATGVCTATTFSGSGASLTNLPAANLTGTLPAISGANLTGISGVSVANQADNRLITATGTTDALNGEATATYNGTKLFLSGGSGNDQHIPMLELKHLNTAYSSGNGDGPALLLNGYYASNEWALAKIAAVNAGGQYGSGYAGGLQFWVHPANGTQTASVIKGAEIIGDGTGANLTINDGNLIIGTSGHGISFAATADGPQNVAELLDDYEEGTFVPYMGYSTTQNDPAYSGQSGQYVKIGKLVTFQARVNLTSAGSGSGNVKFTNFPFAPTPSSGILSNAQVIVKPIVGVDVGGDREIFCQFEGGQTAVYLYTFAIESSGGYATFTSSNIDNNAQVAFFGHYYTDS